MKIIPARRSDALAIGHAICEAIGEEIALGLAGNEHTVEDVARMFASLAEREDTQYSYRNTLVAVDEDDNTIGVCVAYDGAGLHRMREHFIKAASDQLGITFGELDDECQPTEFYIDTLAVDSKHRGQGIATALLRATIERAAECGKPAGLLVEKNNDRARRVYERVGFRKVGELPFVHVVMDHLQYQPCNS